MNQESSKGVCQQGIDYLLNEKLDIGRKRVSEIIIKNSQKHFR